VLIAALVVIAGLNSVLLALYPARRELAEGTPVVEAILHDPRTPSAGPLDADVTIVEFSDYLCAPCKLAEASFERVVASDGRVRVLYKDWPILGEESRSAAQIALAAERQRKYLAVHNALLRTPLRLTPDNVRQTVIAAGANWGQVQADLVRDGVSIDKGLRGNSHQAWTLGLQGAPGYLVGPYLVRGRIGESELTGLIRMAREHQKNHRASALTGPATMAGG
jgi:protein-disulfide isomerase